MLSLWPSACSLSLSLSISVILYSKYQCHPGCSSLCFCCGNCALRWLTRTQYSRQPGWQAEYRLSGLLVEYQGVRCLLLGWQFSSLLMHGYSVCLFELLSEMVSAVFLPLGPQERKNRAGKDSNTMCSSTWSLLQLHDCLRGMKLWFSFPSLRNISVNQLLYLSNNTWGHVLGHLSWLWHGLFLTAM